MNGFSLCAGGGALDLALQIAFPAVETIAAIENNPEAARRFRLRYPQAKLFRDVVGFNARPLHGIVDCVIAGWPCQPHSVAGKRLGTADERWIWSDIARILDETGAPLFFGENVSGLLRDATGQAAEDDNGQQDNGDMDNDPDRSMGGMGTVLRDLAALGFLSFWGSLRASQVGASHGRPRVFILAYRHGYAGRENSAFPAGRNAPGGGGDQLEHAGFDERRRRIRGIEETASQDEQRRHRSGRPDGAMADTSNGQLSEPWRRPDTRNGVGPTGPLLGDAAGTRLPERRDDSGLWEFQTFERTGPGMENTPVQHAEFPERQRTGSEETPGTASQRNAAGSGMLLEYATRSAAPGDPGRGWGIRGAGDPLETFAPGPIDPIWLDILSTNPYLAPALSPVTKVLADALSKKECDFQAEIESGFRGLVDGMAGWLVERRLRLQIGGNGVVPLQAAAVFRKLAQIAGIESILLSRRGARDVTARVPEGAIPGVGTTARAERL